MVQDITDQYITTILSQCDIGGKVLLEVGCGKGRITRDLATHAKRVVASDPDAAALEMARATVVAGNVEFVLAPTGLPDFPAKTFDLVIYTLSLHHVPDRGMSSSLRRSGGLLAKDGVIVVVEPGDGGSYTEAKERFGAGSGDERPARESAIRAMHALEGWVVGATVLFRTLFQFDNDEDFLSSMLPGYRQQPESFLDEVRRFLALHRTGDRIVLEAGRRLNVLRRTGHQE
ncbi:MAG TPA: class I SAM-dependent methyltransferase [Geomonas sp.]